MSGAEQTNLNERQLKFAERYVETGKKQQSAIDAGYAEAGAHVTASELLKNPKVQEAIQELREARQADMRNRFVTEAENAMKVMLEIMNDPEEKGQTRYNAAKDILDRAGYKPGEKVEHTGKDGGAIEITDPKQQLLDRLAKLSGRGIETKAD